MKWSTKDNNLRFLLNKVGEFTDEHDIVQEFKDSVLPYIKKTEPWKSMPTSFFEKCDLVNTVYTANLCLDELYDYADENRIWIGM